MTRTEHWKHQPRAGGRFTAERTTETTTTVTERLTVEPAAPARPGDPTPVFTRLLASAQWDPGFAAYLAGRPEPAVLPPAVTPAAPVPYHDACTCTCPYTGSHDPDCAVYGPPPEPDLLPDGSIDWEPEAMRSPRMPYLPLAEATLAHEFTDADQARLEATLGPGEYLT